MKVVNNSDEYGSYTTDEHIENLKRLANLTKQADELGTGTGGIDEMMTVAVKTALAAGLSIQDVAAYSQKSLDNIEKLKSEQ